MSGVLIYGFHAVISRIRHSPQGVTELYLERERQDGRMQDLLRLAGENNIRVILAERHRLDNMSGHARHQGVVAVIAALPQYQDIHDVLEKLTEPALLLALDGVQDPHNLGACLRVADAMGVHAVIAPRDRAVGLNATVRKVASGAAETVPFITVTNLSRTLRELQDENIWAVGMASEAEQELHTLKLDGALVWVLGAEGEGLRRLTRETCAQLARIPMHGSVESLNVSVASGICLYETRRQRSLA